MGKKPRIFVADDDNDLLEILHDLFASAGYEVVSAASAEETMRVIGDAVPDMVILDVMMEDMYAGLRVARFLRDTNDHPENQRFMNVPILMLTSIHMQTDRYFRECLARWTLPIDSCLEKPVAIETLLDEVRRMLGHERV